MERMGGGAYHVDAQRLLQHGFAGAQQAFTFRSAASLTLSRLSRSARRLR
jgi:hypothetical protein